MKLTPLARPLSQRLARSPSLERCRRFVRATSAPCTNQQRSPPRRSPQSSPHRSHAGGGVSGLHGTLTATLGSSPGKFSHGGSPRRNSCRKHPMNLTGRGSISPHNRSVSPQRRSASPIRNQTSGRRPSLSTIGAGNQHSPSPPASPSRGRAEMTRRPSEVAGYGDPHDPFACTHLSELMPITPMESTYRANSGSLVFPSFVIL